MTFSHTKRSAHIPLNNFGLRFCMPASFGLHGAGLGNEFIPWARAWIAAQVLEAKLIDPAFGCNSRGYGKYFDSPRYDWVFNRLIERLLPRVEFKEKDYLEHGGGDVAQAIKSFAEARNLHTRKAFILVTGGMWGGFHHIQSARDFVRARLYQNPATARNLFRLRQKLAPDKLLVTMHVRFGDFNAPIAVDAYRGKFNVSLPLAWYERVAESLFNTFGDAMQLLVVTDGREDQMGTLISRYGATTTCGMRDSDCSDMLALASGDLTVCSVSSYSMWAAFLSDSPYLWFEPNLQQFDKFYSIWGHEPTQQKDNAPTKLASQHCDQSGWGMWQKGTPVGMDGVIPKSLIEQLHEKLRTKQPMTDLLTYGVVPVCHGSSNAEAAS